MDSAALAGADSLPNNPGAAQTAAVALAKANAPDATPAVSLWCVVASTGAAKTVAPNQIPGICNPGTTAGTKCNDKVCAIPCTAVVGHICNTITVTDDKDVPFFFAPVIGYYTGNTGAISANACRGACGSQTPNPMNIALVADRTGSMATDDRNQMVAGIKSTLQTMTRDQQYVALGTIHRSSATPGSCITTPSSSATSGPWIPVPYQNNYTLNPVTPGGVPPLNTASPLVSGLTCLTSSSGGTYLASPLKAAARYVLGLTPNNLGTLPTRSYPPRNAIIFETDGQPNEAAITGSTALNTTSDIGSTNGTTACNNLKAVATNTKAAGVLVVTVSFGDANSAHCAGSSGEFVRDVLAGVASPDARGNASDADNDCSTATLRAVENFDSDFFFCAATGAELGPIFVSAVNAISPNSKLVVLPV